jgi:hypothetical protein
MNTMSQDIREKIVVSTAAKLIAEVVWWVVVWFGSNAVAEKLTSNLAVFFPWIVTGVLVVTFSYFGRRSPHIRAFLMAMYEYLINQGLQRILGLIVLGGSAYIGYLIINDARIFIVVIGLVLASVLLQSSFGLRQPSILKTFQSYLQDIKDQDVEQLPRFWPLSESSSPFFISFKQMGSDTMKYKLEGRYTFNGVVFDLWTFTQWPGHYRDCEVLFPLPEVKDPDTHYYAIKHVKKIHLLMNAYSYEHNRGKVKESVRNRKIGDIGLIFERDAEYSYDLILGDNIRFPIVNRRDNETSVVSTSNPSTMVAWQGKDDDDELVLDHLQIEVPGNLRDKKLMGIRFRQELLQYFVFAVTLEFDEQ